MTTLSITDELEGKLSHTCYVAQKTRRSSILCSKEYLLNNIMYNEENPTRDLKEVEDNQGLAEAILFIESVINKGVNPHVFTLKPMGTSVYMELI